jgi:hypothetical protein
MAMAQRGAKCHSRIRSSSRTSPTITISTYAKLDDLTKNVNCCVNYSSIHTVVWLYKKAINGIRQTLFALIRTFPALHTLSSEYSIIMVTQLNHANSSSKLYIYIYMVLVYRPKSKPTDLGQVPSKWLRTLMLWFLHYHMCY